jgi:hypothetical protein
MSWLAAQAPAAARLGAPASNLRGPAIFDADPDAAPGTLPPGEAARLSMYDAPPAGAVSIEDFEGAALDRLRGACFGGVCVRMVVV